MDNKINSVLNECLNCKNATCIKGCPVNNNILNKVIKDLQ